MKNLPILLLMLFTAVTASAKRKTFTTSKIQVGKTIEGTPIIATEYNTRLTIVDYYCDTNRNQVLLLLDKINEGAGESVSLGMYTLALYDVSQDSILWEKRFQSLYTVRHICNDDVFIIYFPNKKSVCYNKQDASQLWETKERVTLINDSYQLAICASGVALDLKTGQKKWAYPLDDRFEWSDIMYPDDSNIIIVNNGIYYINLSTGKGWNQADKTWGMGGSLGDWQMNHVCSNIFVDSGKIFWASKRTLSCYDMNGHTQWRVPLPIDSTSKSFIKKDGNGHLLLFNIGLAFKKSPFGYGWNANNYHIVEVSQPQWDWGKPFIASYNITDGSRRFIMPLHDAMQNAYTSQDDNTLILNEPDELLLVNCTSGTIITEKPKKNTLLEEYTLPTLYRWRMTADNKFYPLDSLFPNNYFLQNQNDEILRVSLNFDIIDTLGAGSTFNAIYHKDNLWFLDGVGKTYIIKNHELMTSVALKNPEIMRNKLVGISRHSIRIIDKTGFF